MPILLGTPKLGYYAGDARRRVVHADERRRDAAPSHRGRRITRYAG